MSDLIPGGGDYTPTNVLAKQGINAVGGIVGGVALLVMGALPPLIGVIAGVIVGVIGIGGILSKDPGDRKPGLLAAAAGALSILARIGIIRPLAGTLLSISAVGGIVGGLALVIIRALPPFIGIVAGVIVGVIGIGGILSKDPDDHKPGFLAAAAGALSILARIGIIRPLAGTLLGISALGLLAMGIWNGVKFIKGLKSRS
jgi:hypothetical protein